MAFTFPLVRTLGATTLLLVVVVAPAFGQKKIYDERPFDRITLNAANNNEVIKVRTIDFPGRQVPSPLPSGRLIVRLVDRPGQPYELLWSAIARVELFEQIILTEAMKLTEAGKFDDAFDYFLRLHKSYPDMPGLAQATSRYLQRNALATFRDGEYDRALAILASLYQEQPGANGLARAVDTVADQIIQGHVKKRDLRTARSVLDVVEQEFANLSLTVVDRWRVRFQEGANDRVNQGARAFRAKNYRTARTAATQALAIWPEHERARQLLELVQRANPTVVVGVRTAAALPLSPRVDSPASLRTGFLAAQTLTRITDYSTEGGIYASPIGAVGLDATGRELSITVLDYPQRSPAALDAAGAVARWLLRAGNPRDSQHLPVVSHVLGAVLTPEPDVVVAELSRTHVRPEALLHDVPLSACNLPAPYGSYRAVPATDKEDNTLQLEALTSGSAVANIDERPFMSDAAAMTSLINGDIDLLDRVAPWQVAPLRENKDVLVGQYRLPTVHVLIPTHHQKILDSRELRRAVCYGIDREWVLNKMILADQRLPGYQVVSGPFPTGMSLSDGVRYGYNDAVRPRPYEPRLAALLARLAWANVQRAEREKNKPAPKKGQEPAEEDEVEEEPLPPLPKFRLAHSTDPVARTACQAIVRQLAPLGLKFELVELSPESLLAEDPEFDFRYAELSAWEPAVDAMRVLGPNGVAGRCSDPMFEALKRLDDARNWNEAHLTLRDIHELAAGDLPVIPLWQTGNYYAYRRNLIGAPASTIHLYQSVGDWRKELSVARRP